MNNQEYLSEIIGKINWILEKHDAMACDIPESLIAYAIICNHPDMIEAFLEDGFVALKTDQRFRTRLFKPDEPYNIFYPKENLIPPIEKIIFNPPATIVFWDDGEKTVVKRKESEEFDYECGLAFAIAKRYFGSRSGFKKAIGRAKKIMRDPDSDVKSTKHSGRYPWGSSCITDTEIRLTNSYINERLREYFLGERNE